MKKIALFMIGFNCEGRQVHVFGVHGAEFLAVVNAATYDAVEKAAIEFLGVPLSDQNDPNLHLSRQSAQVLSTGEGYRTKGYAINLPAHGVRPLPEPGLYKILENGDFETVFKPE